VALGSLMELDTQLIIAKNLNFLSNESLNDLQSKTDEIGKMLNGLIKYRKSKL
jgi:four helix bundle protein